MMAGKGSTHYAEAIKYTDCRYGRGQLTQKQILALDVVFPVQHQQKDGDKQDQESPEALNFLKTSLLPWKT